MRKVVIILICVSFAVSLFIGFRLHTNFHQHFPDFPVVEIVPENPNDSTSKAQGNRPSGRQSFLDVVNEAAIEKSKEIHEYAKKKAFEKLAHIVKIEKHVHPTGVPRNNINKRLRVLRGIKIDRPIDELYGVGPEMSSHYSKLNGKFKCLDGKQIFPQTYINDNFCDCDDGSDEPGTSACVNGRFFCKGDQTYILSSLVNDGICDCCDGTDEWRKNKPVGFVLPERAVKQYAPCKNVCS
eukprot:gene8665-14681_t